MGYFDLASHGLVYAAVIVGIIYVAALAAITMRKSWKRALKIGFTQDQLKRVAKASAVYSLIPAVAVLAGFFTLAPVLGIPLSWWRLSVIGNTAYELMAANVALNAAGVAQEHGVANIAGAGGSAYVLTMYVMAIGIMGGMVFAPLLSKKIQKGAFRLIERDRRWNALRGSVYMATILLVFAAPIVLGLSIALFAFAAGAASMAVLKLVIRKTGAEWLNEFALTLSMLSGVLAPVLWALVPK
ncbi:MAG: DUF5058 family protein [Clostridiales bacterium]|jgi:hypothetical protein|nr:DUF5058 family protein [Clostridiales bacterium]